MSISENKLPNDPLEGISIEELGNNLRSGLVTCREITSIYFERIEALNSKLHSYIYFNKAYIVLG
jgi:Asp-tRNA(Asn)/Glu-tRNA(Gln) amidotransferase A subunit family amidase